MARAPSGSPPVSRGRAEPVRLLIYLPIIHSQEDLGGMGEAIRRATTRRLGQRGFHHKTRVIAERWTRIARVLDNLKLDYPKVRLYQDGLPVCGREAELVTQLARTGSRNFRLLQELQDKGAVLMGTEAPELLQQEYELARAGAGSPAAQVITQALLQARDRFIAQRINDTLNAGETGILFLGLLHQPEAFLNRDIRVLYPLGPRR